jgi:hypothetical protein
MPSTRVSHRSSLLSLVVALALAVNACGPEEEQDPPPQERCELDNLKAFLEGSVDDGDSSHTLSLSTDDSTPGWIGINEIRLNLGVATPPDGGDPQPVILRLYDAKSDAYLSEIIDDLTADGDILELDVFNASQMPAGSEDLTRLNHHECSIEDGTICAQIGFDAAGDDILFDDDHYVYNALGGTVVIEGFDGVSRFFSGHWDLELGRNILRYNDESQGLAQGCFRPRYTVQSGDEWPLE